MYRNQNGKRLTFILFACFLHLPLSFSLSIFQFVLFSYLFLTIGISDLIDDPCCLHTFYPLTLSLTRCPPVSLSLSFSLSLWPCPAVYLARIAGITDFIYGPCCPDTFHPDVGQWNLTCPPVPATHCFGRMHRLTVIG